MTKVSIIMPVYNAASFLEDCLNSILSQFFTDWELLAVDDYSMDNSATILTEYAKRDNRIKLISNKEKGIIPALQNGYQQSKASYITRMDADDIMPENKLNELYNSVNGKEHTVTVGKVKYFSTNKHLSDGYIKYAHWLNTLIDANNHYENIYKECILPSPCWMMNRTTFERVGGFKSWRYPEDYDLVFRIYKHNVKVLGIDKILHLWRDHDGRSSRNDANYADQNFTHLKVHYFQELDRNDNKELILWGAGRAGKSVAKLLMASSMSFTWITDNENKIGHNIYGTVLKSTDILNQKNNCQIITAIKTPDFHVDNELIFGSLKTRRSQIFHFY